MDISSEIEKDEYFEWIYDNYFERVYKFLSYRLGNRSELSDLTSIVFLKIYEALDSYDNDKGTLDVWIFRIARNTLYDYYRKNSKRKFVSMDQIEDLFESDHRVEREVEKKSEVEYLRNLVAYLPEREKNIIALKFGAELKNTEIANLLGLSVSNVGVILHRTISQLRADMEDFDER